MNGLVQILATVRKPLRYVTPAIRGGWALLVPLLVITAGAELKRQQNHKIDKKTLTLCESYDWPGNIRELLARKHRRTYRVPW